MKFVWVKTAWQGNEKNFPPTSMGGGEGEGETNQHGWRCRCFYVSFGTTPSPVKGEGVFHRHPLGHAGHPLVFQERQIKNNE